MPRRVIGASVRKSGKKTVALQEGDSTLGQGCGSGAEQGRPRQSRFLGNRRSGGSVATSVRASAAYRDFFYYYDECPLLVVE
jgi:hypothetical protein